MKKLSPILVGIIAAVLAGVVDFSSAHAQSRFGERTVGGSVNGLDASRGSQQVAEMSSEFAIQRDPSSFVGASSADNFRSQVGAAGLGGPFGQGTGLGAGLSFGSNLVGGLGGFGGGLGGFGGGFGGMGGVGRGAQRPGQMGLGQGGQTQTPIRAPLRIGFTPATRSGAVVSERFTRRLQNLPGVQLETPITVEMDGRTAILRGVVTSENDRDLVARLALLESGISEVRNELRVAGSPESP